MLDDTTLLDAWRAGDSKAGGVLFERHFESIRRYFRNKCPAQMEDLIQETFLACVEGQHRFRGEGTFRSYLFGIATYVLYRHLRQKARASLDFGVTSIQAIGPSPSRIAADREEHRLLAEALRQIPIDQQVTLELYYFEGLRGPEIARALDVAEGTVRSRLRRGVDQLREKLKHLAATPEQAEVSGRQLDGAPGSLIAVVDALRNSAAP